MHMKIIKKLFRKLCFIFQCVLQYFRSIQKRYYDYLYRKDNYVFVFSNIKTKFYLPYYKEDWIQSHILKNNNYFEYKELDFVCFKWGDGRLGKLLHGNTVIDIGANIGNHTLYYINECGAGCSYCFEPMGSTFEMLKKNVELNNISEKVRLFNYCVGSSSGMASVSSYNIKNIGGTTFEASTSGDVELVTIDQFQYEGSVVLIKIDVEGYEMEVLKGMGNTIRLHKPILQIEIRNKNFNEVNHLLEKEGYIGFLIERDYDFCNYIYSFDKE